MALRVELQRGGMILVHMAQDAGFRRGEGVEAGGQQRRSLDPVDAAEAGDEMGARDGDPVEMKIGEAGIGLGRGVAGAEAGEKRWILYPLGAAEEARARPG